MNVLPESVSLIQNDRLAGRGRPKTNEAYIWAMASQAIWFGIMANTTCGAGLEGTLAEGKIHVVACDANSFAFFGSTTLEDIKNLRRWVITPAGIKGNHNE